MMQLYTRKEDQVTAAVCGTPDWAQQYDVIVVGAGSGGLYAALSARREGKRVLLLEKSRWCGGQHIQGLVNGYYYGVRGGLYDTLDKAAAADDVFYDPTDAKRLAVAETLARSGIEVHTRAFVTGLYAEGQFVCGVQARIGRRPVDIGCRMLVDGTSDGHLLRLLPIPLHMGRPGDGEPQPFSSMRCVYLDKSEYDGGLSVTVGPMGDRYGLFHEYRDNGYVCQYDDAAFTAAILRAHASHLRTLGAYSRFLYLAPLIGLREGVLYEGEYFLTLSDVLEGKVPTDNLLLSCFSDVDKHGSDMAFDAEIYQDWFVTCNMSTCTVYIPIPVGAVVPKGWKGMLTAGRCISADSYVNSATRMNTDCFRIGEAVGTLAAMAADCGQDPMAVPASALHDKLAAYGFFAEEQAMAAGQLWQPSFWTPAMGPDRRYVHWITDPEELRAALSTDCPGVALWSCRLAGREKLGDAVWQMSQTDDEMLHRNAGIALGVMHDERALPILHEIIRDRKPFYFMDCRRSNQMRSVIAICLCGQMADAGIADELLAMLRPEEYDRPMYHTLLTPEYKRTIVKEQNSVYFQHISHVVAALVKIALAHPARREEIRAALHEALDNGSYIRRMTDAPVWNAFYSAARNCRDYLVRHLG